ncbi:hypothetical protein M378DRAFT_182424 [Amanita muscaria Koide BX008]|uniref:Uncharacterized protein n=1 Tax=Amanita muscaria (strain Koide BX008) TaxID=946122 RepID=A0A0C2RWR9_AMAMK|nr:hypothetical protein M378DRAFT_182424 [Amanita muscaria Koide BX008]
MSNLPAPYLEDPSKAYSDESRARARIAQSLRRLSDVLPPPSASDSDWQRLWENFSTQLSNYDRHHLSNNGRTLPRPPELHHMRGIVIDHIVQHYRPSWSVWARPDFNPFIPPSDDEESEQNVDDDFDETGPALDERATTPPPSPSPLESGRSLKRTTLIRSPQSPDEQATIRASKRNRAKKAPPQDDRQQPDVRPQNEVAVIEWDPRPIPVPFPSSLSISQLKQIRRHKLSGPWVEAGESAGVIADPVSLSIIMDFSAILSFVSDVQTLSEPQERYCSMHSGFFQSFQMRRLFCGP